MNKFFIIILFSFLTMAQSGLTIVAVGNAQSSQEKIFIQYGPDKELSTVAEIMMNDLNFYQSSFQATKATNASKSLPSFSELKLKAFSYGILIKSASAETKTYTVEVYNVFKEEKLSSQNLVFNMDLRNFAHRASAIGYRSIVGKDSIFNDKVIFVSDYKMKKGIKELFRMDFDGGNIKQLTFHRGLVISPSVSPKGNLILYSLIDETVKGRNKNINLMLLNLETGKSDILSRKDGINSGAIFSEDGNSIYLTMSLHGNAEIYKMDLATRESVRLTRNSAPDVDPSINATGNLMTFLSGRPGNPMIYTMIPTSEENSVKRISYVGKFNATPRFSPDGREIVFSSWLDERFDLFKINSDGTGLGRLTKDFGSNEDPDYSKDGQFILFTNQRVISRSQAVQNIYIMDTEGKILGPITQNYGKCISPRWSKVLN